MAATFRSASIRGVGNVNSSTCSIPVPAGATAGDIVTVYVGSWSPSGTVSPPDGTWTEIAQIQGGATRIVTFWKRLTGSDTGTYDFTGTGSWTNGAAICWQGGLASGNPIADFDFGSANGTSYPTLSVIADTGSGLAWLSFCESTDNTNDVPDGYTALAGQEKGMTAWVVANSTGTQTATGATANSSMDLVDVLVAIAPEPGGATDITPDDAIHLHTADQPALTATHVLTADDADHLHTADQATVTTADDVLTDDAAHVQTAGEPTLTQTHQLAADDTDHLHTADDPVVGEGAVVAPDGSTHLHEADEPALTQLHVLAANDADHLHVASSPAVFVPGAVEGSLTVAGALNEIAGTQGLTEVAAANASIAADGLTLAEALNAMAGTDGLTETAAANSLAGPGTEGRTLQAALNAYIDSLG